MDGLAETPCVWHALIRGVMISRSEGKGNKYLSSAEYRPPYDVEFDERYTESYQTIHLSDCLFGLISHVLIQRIVKKGCLNDRSHR